MPAKPAPALCKPGAGIQNRPDGRCLFKAWIPAPRQIHAGTSFAGMTTYRASLAIESTVQPFSFLALMLTPLISISLILSIPARRRHQNRNSQFTHDEE
jgi:hypothetical protein